MATNRKHLTAAEHEPGDKPAPLNPADHNPAERTGYDRVIVAPSLPLGIEAVPEAEALLDDFHRGVLELGAPFELWASLALQDPIPARVDTLLDAGAVGLSLPAGALDGPVGIESLGPALEALARSGKPLFIHPGPAAGPGCTNSGLPRVASRSSAGFQRSRSKSA